MFATPQNQRKCILPMNDITTTLYYNTRVAISAPIKLPVIWHCSKVEQTAPKGSNRLTFAQEMWDEHTDAFAYEDGTFSPIFDPTKKIIGIYADYYKDSVVPEEVLQSQTEPIPNIHSEITYSGKISDIKVKGSAKKFTVNFFDINNQEVSYQQGTWKYEIYFPDTNPIRTDATSLVEVTTVTNNQIKVKFIGDSKYIGSVLVISHTTTENNIYSEVEMNIVSL